MASSGEWQVVFALTSTDETVASFDCEITRLSRYLSPKVGELEVRIPVPNAAVGVDAYRVFGGEGRMSMYVYRGRELWWGGFLDETEVDSGSSGGYPMLIASGATFESYPDRRELREDRTSEAMVEQTAWAKNLWDYMQRDYGGSIGVQTPQPAPSGRGRSMTWLRSDTRTVGSVLKEISNRVDGFEWIIDVHSDNTGMRQRTLRTGYPRIGRPNSGYSMSYPGAIITYSIRGDATEGATSFQARGKTPDPIGTAAPPGGGSGSSEKQPPIMSGIHTSEEWLRAGYTLTDTTIDRDTVTEVSTLNDWAKLAKEMRTGPLVLPEVTARLEGFGQEILGADVRLRITDYPFPQRPGGAPGWEGTCRCIGYEVDPGEFGSADVVKLIFENPYDEDNLERSPD